MTTCAVIVNENVRSGLYNSKHKYICVTPQPAAKMKTSIAILLTILSVAAASPLFFGHPKHEHHIIHVPYHVHKVPVYIKEPVYVEKPVYIYKTVDHHDHHYHHDDHSYDHYSHDDHYGSHY